MLFPYSLCGSFGPNGMESKVIGKFSYATQLKNPSNMPLGIMGYALSIQQNAQLSFSFNENFKGKTSKSLTIWIHSPIDTIHITLDGSWILKERKSIGLGVYTYNYENSDAPSSCNITAQINCDFWGLQFNHSQGLSYQQNGLVGAQFTHLITHQDYVLKQLSELKPDLLIFSYGTNEAYEIIDSVSYFKKVSSFIKLVQSIVPDASILITNAPDTRSSGRKPPSQVLVNETLRNVSVQCHTAYFDLNKAMGGWGSLYSWSKKGFVLKDQLHFNKEGARILGLLMAEALFSAANIGVETTRDYMKKEISIALCKKPNDPNQNEQIDSKTEKPTPQSGKKKQTEPSKNNRFYIVKKGDTLSAIAKKTNTSVATLCKKNKISQNTIIRPGQKLKY